MSEQFHNIAIIHIDTGVIHTHIELLLFAIAAAGFVHTSRIYSHTSKMHTERLFVSFSSVNYPFTWALTFHMIVELTKHNININNHITHKKYITNTKI